MRLQPAFVLPLALSACGTTPPNPSLAPPATTPVATVSVAQSPVSAAPASSSTTAPANDAPSVTVLPVAVTSGKAVEYIEGSVEVFKKTNQDPPDILFRGVVHFEKSAQNQIRTDQPLVWERTGLPAELSFADAELYCKKQGMRLPTTDELIDLVDARDASGDLDECAFRALGSLYWTATPGEYLDTRWRLDRAANAPSAGSLNSTGFVRCVRDLAEQGPTG
jgi:hypothetical protein